MGVFLTAGALGLTCFLLCLPALGQAVRWRYAVWSTLFVWVLTTATDLRRVFPALPRLPGHYNWTGKLFELIVCVLFMAWLLGVAKWRRQALGLRWSFDAGTGRAVARVLGPVVAVEFGALWFLVPGERPAWEDHFFQLTAPGLTEELAFRGVLLALLDRAFPRRVRVLGAELGWGAVVSSLVFGLWHGLDVSSSGQLSLAIPPLVIPTLGGFVLAWCRARSGSLVLPVLVHAGMNEVANLIALVKALL